MELEFINDEHKATYFLPGEIGEVITRVTVSNGEPRIFVIAYKAKTLTQEETTILEGLRNFLVSVLGKAKFNAPKKEKNESVKAQLGRFFGAVNDAAKNLDEDPELYRKRVMKEELGVEHLRLVTKTTGFETLMRRVLGDAGQYEAALEYVGGDVKRMRYLAIRAADRILGYPGELATAKYIAGIFIQMNLSRADPDSLALQLMRPDGWDDFVPIQLKKVVAALQKHVRRRF